MFKCSYKEISSEARLAMQHDMDLVMSLLLLQNELVLESVSSHKCVRGFVQHIHAAASMRRQFVYTMR